MADEINIISDKDLQAPLDMARNYNQLADTFDSVVTSTTKLNRELEDGAKSLHSQDVAAKELVNQQKKLDEANKKAAKSQKSYADATNFANEATGGMVSRVKDLGKQFIALVATPVGAFLLAIAGALASVGAYFKTTNVGADKFEKIMASLQGVMDFLTNKVAALGEQIVKLFEDGNALGEVFSFIFDQIINRVSGVIDVFTNLLKIVNVLAKYNLKDILTGDLKPEDLYALKKATTDLGKAAIQSFTGIGDAAEQAAAKVKSLQALTELGDTLGDETRDRILSKAQALLDIEKQMFVFKDKANHTDQERVEALQKAIDISEEQLQIDIDLATRKERLFTAELLHRTGIINSEEEANRVIQQGTTLLQDQLLEQKAIDSELEERRKLQADTVNLQREFFAENKKNIAQLGALQKEIDEESIKRAEVERDARIRIFDEQLKAAKQVSGAQILGIKEGVAAQEDLTKRFNQRLVDDAKARAAKEKEIEKAKTEALAEEIKKRQELEAILFAAAAVAQTVVIGFIDQRRQKLDEDSALAEEQRKKELDAAGDDAIKKLAINRKFDREQAKIKQKQAQADKQAALFNILISTAMGIARVAPNPVLIALVAAIGAVQAAFVASKPLPKFWMGTPSSPDSFIAGDRGRELVTNQGRAIIADKPTIFTGMEGSRVFNNRDTEEILGDMSDVGYALNYGSKVKTGFVTSSIVGSKLEESNRLLRKIASRPEASLYVDEDGFGTYADRLSRKQSRINKRFRGR